MLPPSIYDDGNPGDDIDTDEGEFLAWCKENDIDPTDRWAEDNYAEEMRERAREDAEWDRAEARAEAMADRWY